MILAIIYGILGIISITMFSTPKTFLLLFNYVFNTPSIYDLNTLLYIYIAILLLIIILVFKNHKHLKIKDSKLVGLLFIINLLLSLVLRNNKIVSIRIIIIEFIINILLLFNIKKIKLDNKKDSFKLIIILTTTIFFTKLLNIYNYLIIYFVLRLSKVNSNLTFRYIITILLSDIISFIAINASFISINNNLIIITISSLLSGLYMMYNYYKTNYNRLKWFYLIILIFLLYFFR